MKLATDGHPQGATQAAIPAIVLGGSQNGLSVVRTLTPWDRGVRDQFPL